MEVKDPVYSFEIARRAVGRAALHLGVDSMTEASLDVMADILLNYLNRVGRTLSHLVEASGRTSAHVNLLDALQACQVVASPAIQRLHLRDADDDGNMFAASAGSGATNSVGGGTQLSADWEGLAAFLDGPRWMDEKDEPKEVQGLGGKQGPSASEGATKQSNSGWDAPYLDEVPPFPRASESCANPHPLPPHTGLSLHRAKDDTEEDKAEADQNALDQIPDQVFTASWGTIRRRKRDQTGTSATNDVDMPDAPPTKKVRLDAEAKKYKASDDKAKGEGVVPPSTELQAQIPSFYPPPPVIKVTTKESRTIVDAPPASRADREDKSSLAVRSSLVQLGSYWGSGWDEPSEAPSQSLAVPMGRGDSGEQSTTATVIPVARASGSRVSRILEGSMDAAAMQ